MQTRSDELGRVQLWKWRNEGPPLRDVVATWQTRQIIRRAARLAIKKGDPRAFARVATVK